eukprot:TRINITY_DN22056_c0_g1_i1.p1 TRINITY_DN22056_c0_g1~~TRINITY_DN22056_c0_g1_i1.p1  ORF type:complete len:804 (+),score=226.62 TRINITY_DN22056_c0_g1_i1:111-2414(+)
MAPEEKPPLVGAPGQYTKLGMMATRSGMSEAVRRRVIQQEMERRKILNELREAAMVKLHEEQERKRAAEEERIRKKEERAAQLEADRARREEERKIRESMEQQRRAEFDASREEARPLDPEEQKRMMEADALDRERRQEAREAHRRALEERQRNKRAVAHADKVERQLSEAPQDDWRKSEDVEFADDEDFPAPRKAPAATTYTTIAEKMREFTKTRVFRTQDTEDVKAATHETVVESEADILADLDEMSFVSHVLDDEFEFEHVDIAEEEGHVKQRRTEPTQELKGDLPSLTKSDRRRGFFEYEELPGGPQGPKKTYAQWLNDGVGPRDDIKWVIKSEGYLGGIKCISDFLLGSHERDSHLNLNDKQRAVLVEDTIKRVKPTQSKLGFEKGTFEVVISTFEKIPPEDASLRAVFMLAGKLQRPEQVKSVWMKYVKGSIPAADVYFSAILGLISRVRYGSEHLVLAGDLFGEYFENYEKIFKNLEIDSDPYQRNTISRHTQLFNQTVEGLMVEFAKREHDLPGQADKLWEMIKNKRHLPASLKKVYLKKLLLGQQPQISEAEQLIATLDGSDKGEDVHDWLMRAHCTAGAEAGEKYLASLPKTTFKVGRAWVINDLITGYTNQAMKMREKPEVRVQAFVSGVESVVKRVEELGAEVAWKRVVKGLELLYNSLSEPVTLGTEEERKKAMEDLMVYSDKVRDRCGFDPASRNIKCTPIVTTLLKLYLVAKDQNRANALLTCVDKSSVPSHVDRKHHIMLLTLSKRVQQSK